MENKEQFKELYNKLYSENFNELEVLRKKEEKPTKKILWLVGSIFISCIVFAILEIILFANVFLSDGEFGVVIGALVTMFIGGPILVAIIFVLVSKIVKQAKKTSVGTTRGTLFKGETPEEKTYKGVFKQKIIKPIVELALPESEYFFNQGLTEEEYSQAEWEKYDIYFSEDKVVANININANNLELTMSEVYTKDVSRDSDGGTSEITLFRGLAGYIQLPKDVGCYIKVKNNNINLFGKSKDNVQMDMYEFDKLFDIQTSNKVKAMQILTADIMTELLDIIEKNNFKFEFYINNSIMHIRFHTGDLFEPIVFKDALQFEYLEKYFNIVNSIKNIIENICIVIMETEL